MVETISEDFVRTARAKGLSMRRVYLKHALRAALTSVVTILGLDLAGLLTGTIFTERIFNVQGLGLARPPVRSTLGDLPVIMGVVIFSAIPARVLQPGRRHHLQRARPASPVGSWSLR